MRRDGRKARCLSSREAVTKTAGMSDVNELHRRWCIADGHADSLMWNRDLCVRSSEGHVDFPRLREAGVKLQCFTLVTRGFPFIGGFPVFAAWRGWPREAAPSEWSRALWQIERLEEFCGRSEGQVRITTTAAVLEENLAQGRLSAVLGVEGGHAIEGQRGAPRGAAPARRALHGADPPVQ